jgi:hypothetical protein
MSLDFIDPPTGTGLCQDRLLPLKRINYGKSSGDQSKSTRARPAKGKVCLARFFVPCDIGIEALPLNLLIPKIPESEHRDASQSCNCRAPSDQERQIPESGRFGVFNPIAHPVPGSGWEVQFLDMRGDKVGCPLKAAKFFGTRAAGLKV